MWLDWWTERKKGECNWHAWSPLTHELAFIEKEIIKQPLGYSVLRILVKSTLISKYSLFLGNPSFIILKRDISSFYLIPFSARQNNSLYFDFFFSENIFQFVKIYWDFHTDYACTGKLFILTQKAIQYSTNTSPICDSPL